MLRILQTLFILSVSAITLNAYAALNDEAIKVKWDYKGNVGPAQWGELSPSFALCAKGKLQSPINITKKAKAAAGSLNIHYQPAPLAIIYDGNTDLMIDDTKTIVNDGHAVQANFANQKELITWNGKDYHLIQFHIHSPSENAINGVTSPLEIHFVHQGAGGELLVMGIFVKAGKENVTLRKIIQHMPKTPNQENVVPNDKINPDDLLPAKLDYYYFTGSLTTPPCAEGVQWVVMANPITATPAQIVQIRKATHGSNARPIQSLNGRPIFYSADIK